MSRHHVKDHQSQQLWHIAGPNQLYRLWKVAYLHQSSLLYDKLALLVLLAGFESHFLQHAYS